MKKSKISRIITVLLAIIMVGTVIPLVAVADRVEVGLYFELADADYTIWSPDSTPKDKDAKMGKENGLIYDEKNNTLTVQNSEVNYLSIQNMGEDFALVLVGDNTIGSIGIGAEVKNTKVTLTGSGKLRSTHISFNMYGGYKSSLLIKKDATFVVGDEDTYPASTIWSDKTVDTKTVIQHEGNLDIPINFKPYGGNNATEYILDDAHVHTFSPGKKAPASGLIKGPDGLWALYKNDKVNTSYTGIAKNEYGWWRIVEGYVDFNATGIYKNEFGWWRVEDGKVDFEADGIYRNEYGWWKTTDGKVTFDETGIFKNEYGWWRVEDSKVNFKANGVYKNEYGWWKTKGGKVDFKFTGIAKNKYGTWYVKNGKVDFNKNGKVKFEGKTYTVKNGKVQ